MTALRAQIPENPVQSDLFLSGEHGYNTFRIPALIVSRNGTLLAFCEGRSADSDTGNVDIVIKRSFDNGRSWSFLHVLADFGVDTIGNPTPVIDQSSGTIWLLLTSNPGNIDEQQIMEAKLPGTRTVWITRSDDDGATWITPREITATTKLPNWTWYATGPGNGIQLQSGRLILPCDHTEKDTNARYSHVIFSDDHGETWHLGGTAGPDTNECAVVQLKDGSLLLNMRSHGTSRHRSISRSHDQGTTWTTPVSDTVLVEPVCQASLIRSDNADDILLFSNPASMTKRQLLKIRFSPDGGETWTASRVLYAGPAAYSSLARLSGREIGCLYERGRKNENEGIAFARFTMQWLLYDR